MSKKSTQARRVKAARFSNLLFGAFLVIFSFSLFWLLFTMVWYMRTRIPMIYMNIVVILN